LVARSGLTPKWIPIARGGVLPNGAVFAGRTYSDGDIYVARNERGELGKLNLNEDTMWNIWCAQDGATVRGEVLALRPSEAPVVKLDLIAKGVDHAGLLQNPALLSRVQAGIAEII